MTRVVVTGGSGKVGRAVVNELLEHGYQVVNIDIAPPREQKSHFVRIDLTDFGETLEALSEIDSSYSGVDAIVHLAAIPGPGQRSNAITYHNNTACTYNVFSAAKKLGIKNIAWASSETLLGLPFDTTPPPYAPLDEEYTARPETSYALAKLVDEEIAKQFCRWDPDLKIIGLRLSNVMEPADYARFPSFDGDAWVRKWNLWAYIDARDAAQAFRKALELPFKGFDVFIIANADSVMSRPNAELLAEVFPGLPVKRPFAPNESLLSIEKARRVLGYEPRYSWRNEIG